MFHLLKFLQYEISLHSNSLECFMKCFWLMKIKRNQLYLQLNFIHRQICKGFFKYINWLFIICSIFELVHNISNSGKIGHRTSECLIFFILKQWININIYWNVEYVFVGIVNNIVNLSQHIIWLLDTFHWTENNCKN